MWPARRSRQMAVGTRQLSSHRIIERAIHMEFPCGAPIYALFSVCPFAIESSRQFVGASLAQKAHLWTAKWQPSSLCRGYTGRPTVVSNIYGQASN